jgi:hypothetical protein
MKPETLCAAGESKVLGQWESRRRSRIREESGESMYKEKLGRSKRRCRDEGCVKEALNQRGEPYKLIELAQLLIPRSLSAEGSLKPDTIMFNGSFWIDNIEPPAFLGS